MKIEDYFKYYIQGSDHYLIPKYVFKELFDEMSNWRDESKQLKAKLEMYEYGVYYSSENDKLKEVIEEVREYINSKVISNGEIIDQLRKIEVKELLQILDKVKN